MNHAPKSWATSRAAYHADMDYISNSSISDFLTSVPLYYGLLTGEIERDEPSADMAIGTATHTLWLEPEKEADAIAIAPDCDRRTKAGKETWEAFRSSVGDRLILTSEQYRTAKAMADQLNAHPRAAALIQQFGPVEQPIAWIDEVTGLWCRAMIDKWVYADESGIIVDLKTTSGRVLDPWAFGATAHTFGYHRQAAHYLEGVRRCYGFVPDFVFVVVSKVPPHEVALHTLDADSLELGRQQIRDAIDDIARRRESGDWSSRHANQIYTTRLPQYAFTTKGTNQ